MSQHHKLLEQNKHINSTPHPNNQCLKVTLPSKQTSAANRRVPECMLPAKAGDIWVCGPTYVKHSRRAAGVCSLTRRVESTFHIWAEHYRAIQQRDNGTSTQSVTCSNGTSGNLDLTSSRLTSRAASSLAFSKLPMVSQQSFHLDERGHSATKHGRPRLSRTKGNGVAMATNSESSGDPGSVRDPTPKKGKPAPVCQGSIGEAAKIQHPTLGGTIYVSITRVSAFCSSSRSYHTYEWLVHRTEIDGSRSTRWP